MIGGLEQATQEGTPQGGPLSPLLSNIVLDELDKELEKRGLRFVVTLTIVSYSSEVKRRRIE